MKQLLIETVNNEQPLQIDESSLLEWTPEEVLEQFEIAKIHNQLFQITYKHSVYTGSLNTGWLQFKRTTLLNPSNIISITMEESI